MGDIRQGSLESDFVPGDLVKLKSGGPVMTVKRFYNWKAADAIPTEYGVHCDWIDAEGHPHRHAFYPEQLSKVGGSLSEFHDLLVENNELARKYPGVKQSDA